MISRKEDAFLYLIIGLCVIILFLGIAVNREKSIANSDRIADLEAQIAEMSRDNDSR